MTPEKSTAYLYQVASKTIGLEAFTKVTAWGIREGGWKLNTCLPLAFLGYALQFGMPLMYNRFTETLNDKPAPLWKSGLSFAVDMATTTGSGLLGVYTENYDVVPAALILRNLIVAVAPDVLRSIRRNF